MSRMSRIAAPGALNHIISRGIEQGVIFNENEERDNFVQRLSRILKETGTLCYAWALIPNHFHLLLKTGHTPISTVMRRLLTGYAVYYNRRHSRHGHLFQNRYTSILCQEDEYFKELVRYIHLNPLRANLVKGLDELEEYPYAGHSAVMGKIPNDWQDVRYILKIFDDHFEKAVNKYIEFIQNGVPEGKRDDLTGGGLVRSHGGWDQIKNIKKDQGLFKGDERILGDGNFVEIVLEQAQEKLTRKYRLKSKGVDFDMLTARVSRLTDMEPKEIMTPGKQRKKVKARSVLCYWAHHELCISQAELPKD